MSDLSEFLSAARTKVVSATPGPYVYDELGQIIWAEHDRSFHFADIRGFGALRKEYADEDDVYAIIDANGAKIEFALNVLPALLDVVEAAAAMRGWQNRYTAPVELDACIKDFDAAIARLCQNKEK